MAFQLLYNYPVMGDLFSSLRAGYQGYPSSTCHNTGREQGWGGAAFCQGGASLGSFKILKEGRLLCRVPRGTGSRESGSISTSLLLYLVYYLSRKPSLRKFSKGPWKEDIFTYLCEVRPDEGWRAWLLLPLEASKETQDSQETAEAALEGKKWNLWFPGP